MMEYERASRLVMIGLLLMLAIFAKSVEARYELRSDPPADFAAVVSRNYSASQLMTEQYWQKTRNVLSRYEYGQELPVTPPAGFIAQDSHLTKRQQVAMEQDLWKQVRMMWMDTGSWQKHYHLDFSWVTKMIRSAGSRIEASLPTLR